MIHVFVRNLAMVAIGVLLLMFREQAMPFIVMCIGALFLVPAFFTVVALLLPVLLNKTEQRKMPVMALIMSLGSLLLGAWMLIAPSFFVAILMWVLGGVMVFSGIMQIDNLLKSSAVVKLSASFYVLPVLLTIAGITVLYNPFQTASIPFLILGVAAIISSISDLLCVLYVKYMSNKLKKNEVEQIESTVETEE